MANITTAKEKALKRLQDKISEAQTIKSKLTFEISLTEYKKFLNEAEIWKTSTGNALKQIFSDEHLSKVFLESDDVILSDENTFSENISSLKDELVDDIKKLEHIINDLNESLYTQQGDKETKLAKWGFLQTVIVALITAGAGIFTGYLAIPYKTDPLEKQGLSTITLEGKWKYICTSFDGSYQHGGRFIVQKEADGSLILSGERMWKDIKDTSTGNWNNKVYEESDYLLWHTNWIFVRNNTQMNFEYHIPTVDKEIIGYCSGIINSDNNKVVSVKGNFYVLNQIPILTGQIIFKSVTDDDYNSKTTLQKNH